MSGFDIPEAERQHLGEALIVYIYRALNKPKGPSYFHVKLLDVLLKSTRETFKLSLGFRWANGTNCIKEFNRHSKLDDHPDAPQWAAGQVFGKGEDFALLSMEAIKRIKSMTREKRRQLEAIAALLFPDHEAIRGKAPLYADAHVATARAYLTDEEHRHAESSTCQRTLTKSLEKVRELETALVVVFDDPNLTEAETDKIESELEDLLIGRLELEQPVINVELLARIMSRSVTSLGKEITSKVVQNLANAIALYLATTFPVLSPLLGHGA